MSSFNLNKYSLSIVFLTGVASDATPMRFSFASYRLILEMYVVFSKLAEENDPDTMFFISFSPSKKVIPEPVWVFCTCRPFVKLINQIIKITSISLLLSFLATIYPSIRATKIEPINLIKWD